MFIVARSAEPPSPVLEAVPVPATVEMIPVDIVIFITTWLAEVKYKSPNASRASW
jgi:hypothetical protein